MYEVRDGLQRMSTTDTVRDSSGYTRLIWTTDTVQVDFDLWRCVATWPAEGLGVVTIAVEAGTPELAEALAHAKVQMSLTRRGAFA